MDFSKKRVLVTGGTGTVGSAFVRHLLANDVKKVIIVSRNEEKQVLLRRELKAEFGENVLERIDFVLCDIRNNEVFKKHFSGVDMVVHTAAMKHIDLCEENVQEAYEINVSGTANVVNNCLDYNIEKAILVSTDKACSPSSVYGASKLIAERLGIDANKFAKTRLAVLRGGNICGSAGSVIPFFQSLVKKGQIKLPVTDEKMSRFWFSVKDVVASIDYIFENMVGGEVFVPKMQAFKIVDLAEAISGNPLHDVVGLRSGERVEEPILNENYNIYENDKFYVEWQEKTSYDTLNKSFQKIDFPNYSTGAVSKYLSVEELKTRLLDL